MGTEKNMNLEDRIFKVLKHFNLKNANFVGSGLPDWRGLAVNYPEVISSMTLVCPWGFDPVTAKSLSSRLLVIRGSEGPMAEQVKNALGNLPEVSQVTLSDYAGMIWNDIAADRKKEISSAILDFVGNIVSGKEIETLDLPEEEGEIAGISYHLQGKGKPIVLLPLAMTASQWKPVLPVLNQNYCTILLGGPHLGAAAVLETRASTPGYLRVVQRVVHELNLNSEDLVLDVGCGTGFIDRWLARKGYGLNQITALDLSPYLLGEAMSLGKKEGLDNIITFREGRAESLPFDDNSFSVTTAFTLLEEADADHSLAEMMRVTRKGGHVAAVVRAQDLPLRVNVPIPLELKKKIEIPFGAGVTPTGCADASLYYKFKQLGLSNIRLLPDAIIFENPQGTMEQALLGTILGTLNLEEQEQCRDAIKQAASDSTFFLMQPVHCAVGKKS